MKILPRAICIESSPISPLTFDKTINIPSVALILFLLLISFSAGFSVAALVHIGQPGPLTLSPSRFSKQDLNLPLIIYKQAVKKDQVNENSAAQDWLKYTDGENGFSISYPHKNAPIRFISAAHTFNDYNEPVPVSLLLEIKTMNTPTELKAQLIGRKYLLLSETEFEIEGRKATQYIFQIGSAPQEVFTVVPLEGNKYIVFSYLIYPGDEVSGRVELMTKIINTLVIEK